MSEVIWLLRAQVALQEAFEYEEDIQPDSGTLFLDEVDQTIERIRYFPDLYREVFPPFHRAILGRARRYGLFYTLEDRGIIIHALVDLRQDPQSIRIILRLKPDAS